MLEVAPAPTVALYIHTDVHTKGRSSVDVHGTMLAEILFCLPSGAALCMSQRATFKACSPGDNSKMLGMILALEWIVLQ
jgi:hypothetical protein